MLKRIFFHILVACLSLWLAITFIPGVAFFGTKEAFIICSLTLALLNIFIRPILKKFLFLLMTLSFGLFDIVINMLLWETVDIFFPELEIVGLWPLFLSALIISVILRIVSPD